MAILFDYAVKYNGQYYPPNTPIEEANAEPAQAPEEDCAQAPEEDCAVAAEETVEEKSEAPKKAAKSRKKGDA